MKQEKKQPRLWRRAGWWLGSLLGMALACSMALGVGAEETAPSYGSITLDTAQYTMAPGDAYTIGAVLKDTDGKPMDSQQVRALVRAGVLHVRDSRTGSIVELKEQSNGNFRVIGKQEGTAYILYEIAGTHASVRVDVQKNAQAGGSAVRNTSYFTSELPEVAPLPTGPMVALTFDDGPNGKTTRRIVDTLEKNGGKATFFMVGSRISGDPDTVKRVYESGSEIASHTYDHVDLSRLSAAGIASQNERVNQLLRGIVPVTPSLLRPPYGTENAFVRQNAGMPLILWSVDTQDWKYRNASRTVQTVLGSVKDGDIVLMHDLQTSTADACEILIPELRKRGYQLVTVSELLESRGITPQAGGVYRSVPKA